MLSTVASVATSSGLFGEARPIIALTKTREGSVKISGRLPEGLRSRLNLGNIFREAAERLNGIGGGHDVAAGARMQDGQEEEFLRLVDEAVGRLLDQMNNSRQ
jgi:RecJ-like exonuclease